MSQVSKRFIKSTVQDRIWKLFISSLELCDKGSSISFAQDLFTPTERIMLSKRFSIAYMLSEGYDYSVIADTLKVSTATISNVSMWLKEKGQGYRNILKKIKLHETTRKILGEIEDVIIEIIGKGKGQSWSGTNRLIRDSKRAREGAF